MDILKLFQYHQKMKFSDIEKALKVRSNKLAYHIKNLTKKGILIKEGKYYILSESSEYLIPYLSEKKAMLPVILIHIGKNKKGLLFLRKKRPFKDKLGLPGGRPLTGESISNSVQRIMKEKFNINAKLNQIHSISLEHLKNKNSAKNIHSFLLIFVSASTKDKITLTNLEKNKPSIITSDYLLIKKDLNKKIDIKTINTTKI